MNNTIKVNDAPVTVDYTSLDNGSMYRLPCSGTCIYMVLSFPGGGNTSVNLRTGMIYHLPSGKQVVPIFPGTVVSIISNVEN